VYEFKRPGSGLEKLTDGLGLLARRFREAPSGEYEMDWAVIAVLRPFPRLRNKIPEFA